MGKEKIRVALYCRVGSDEQVGFLMESQQNRLECYAKEAGLKITGIFSDVGTGLSMARPGWNAVLEAASQKQMQVLLVASSQRISRDTLHCHNEIHRLSDLGILTYSLKKEFFLSPLLWAAIKTKGDTTMKKISKKKLRTMTDIEGLVIQNCSGDLRAWVDGINCTLTEHSILRNGSIFRNVSVFKHDGHTNLLLHMDGVDLDMGKLSIWQLVSHSQFGSTWLSDYLSNQLGVNMDEKPIQKEKPDCPLIGQDGNIFNLMGIASRTLKENGLGKQAAEMWDRVTSSGSYSEALCIIGEYVNITSAEDAQEQIGSLGMK